MALLCLIAFCFGAKAQTLPAGAFVTTWTPTILGSTTTINIPATVSGSFSAVCTPISPTTGTAQTVTTLSGGNLTFSGLTNGGTYQIAISGGLTSVQMGAVTFASLTQINQWGNIAWTTFNSAFNGATGLTAITATDMPNLSAVTSMSSMFKNCNQLPSVPNIDNWNESTVTDMSQMFSGASVFNQDISNWNTANVTNMSGMFSGASVFNQNIGNWNTANVTNMSGMFSGASVFNQNIGNWNTANVTNMSSMFSGASVFNQDISGWNTANVTNMNGMFAGASVFNQNIGSWNTANVTTMNWMFNGTGVFNQNIGSWNTANVTTMNWMFWDAPVFNQDISGWNTAKVTSMSGMFWGATAFNQNIGSWNTAKVTDMGSMFQGATAFNQNIGSWNLTSIYYQDDMLSQSGLDCANYSRTLIGWDTATTTPNGHGVTLGAAGLSYDATTGGKTLAARTDLTTTKGWTITGDAAGSCVLPVTLAAFNAVKQNNAALLQWTTATEINNKGFSVERSTDAQTWSSIGFVNSKATNGNSSTSLHYSFTDNNPANGINYYRLKQEDLSGGAVYSQVKSVDFGVKATIYPNPVSSQLNVSVAGNSSYQLINAAGNVVLTGSFTTGNNVLNVGGIAAGTYLLRITSGTSSTVYKVIKK